MDSLNRLQKSTIMYIQNVDKLKCFSEQSSNKNIGNDFLLEGFPVWIEVASGSK